MNLSRRKFLFCAAAALPVWQLARGLEAEKPPIIYGKMNPYQARQMGCYLTVETEGEITRSWVFNSPCWEPVEITMQKAAEMTGLDPADGRRV